MPIYKGNFKYNASLTAGYTVGDTTLSADSVPTNVPTIVTAARGTTNETKFTCTGKTSNQLTGVARLRGANVNLPQGTAIEVVNDPEFWDQYSTAVFDQVGLGNIVYAADGGSTDSYAITLSPAPVSLDDIIGVPILFTANTANTGVATLNVNSLGAITIKKSHDKTLEDNDIEAGSLVLVVYDGADFQLQTPSAKDPYRTIVIPAGSMSPTTTAGCADAATVEAGTNDVDYKVLDFDQSTEENAFTVFSMPDSWNGGTITAKFVWTTAASSGDVIWGIKGRAFANDDPIDQAYGTAQTVTDTFIAAGDIHISSATSAVTLAGTPAGGQLVQLKIYRDADAGGDTLNGDARLIAVQLEYQVAQYSD